VPQQIEGSFEEMHAQLRQLGKKYNPEEKNLHIEAISTADAELFNSLCQLSGRAIEIVKDDDHRYSKNTAYAHAMFDFWFDYFLIINAASNRVIKSANAHDFPQDVIYRIIEDLIDISEFSTIVLGDLYKRNYEALGNTLLAFYSDTLMDLVNNKKETITSDQARMFLDGTIKRIEEIKNKKKGANSEGR
jgi:hypothetical protein